MDAILKINKKIHPNGYIARYLAIIEKYICLYNELGKSLTKTNSNSKTNIAKITYSILILNIDKISL